MKSFMPVSRVVTSFIAFWRSVKGILKSNFYVQFFAFGRIVLSLRNASDTRDFTFSTFCVTLREVRQVNDWCTYSANLHRCGHDCA